MDIVIRDMKKMDIIKNIEVWKRIFNYMKLDGESFDLESTCEFLLGCVKNPDIKILISEKNGVVNGISASLKTKSFFNKKVNVAHELLWHTDDRLPKKTRVKIMKLFLNAVEEWYKIEKIKLIKAATPHWSAAKKILKKNNYIIDELVFRKVVT